MKNNVVSAIFAFLTWAVIVAFAFLIGWVFNQWYPMKQYPMMVFFHFFIGFIGSTIGLAAGYSVYHSI